MKTAQQTIAYFAKELNAAFLAGIVCRECKTPINAPHRGLCDNCEKEQK